MTCLTVTVVLQRWLGIDKHDANSLSTQAPRPKEDRPLGPTAVPPSLHESGVRWARAGWATDLDEFGAANAKRSVAYPARNRTSDRSCWPNLFWARYCPGQRGLLPSNRALACLGRGARCYESSALCDTSFLWVVRESCLPASCATRRCNATVWHSVAGLRRVTAGHGGSQVTAGHGRSRRANASLGAQGNCRQVMAHARSRRITTATRRHLSGGRAQVRDGRVFIESSSPATTWQPGCDPGPRVSCLAAKAVGPVGQWSCGAVGCASAYRGTARDMTERAHYAGHDLSLQVRLCPVL